MKILVTGGAGYIGSHACVVLAARGHEVVVVDNHSNSSPQVLTRIAQLTGAPVVASTVDLRDAVGLARLFAEHRFEAVMHFAALKVVADSIARPQEYESNNVGGTASLLAAMKQASVSRLVFSSSAAVYDATASIQVGEDAPLGAGHPYGQSKLSCEHLIAQQANETADFHAVNLRYFNPVGAHPSGLLGEDPHGTPTNLMPYVSQVAVGQRARLPIFGDDYATPDGTGVRDYLHVMDLARAHADALDFLVRERRSLTANLGTGQGVSVLELVQAFERVSGRAVPYDIVARRAGDVAALYADPSLAQRVLGWRAELDLEAMCRDAWHWQSRNPQGYATS
ncbi:UDP-glucose 4-epimerase GalE [Arenimonas oryziterrae]|uniref:UDP-glucose 4-epimerase n=1 Tax=Arenimonas oryziterrae DSM 21050 = YC6267 TaxID=1121015 RepID=A0A091B2G5_9GAMM|nr:UDP-glucose 4-epimerase GalE [Arenimonas oryziterrae]KFN45074.1 hypothetical protein N789_03365 [Arenimonas oryziterrae DSM 21050 = YC6267]